MGLTDWYVDIHHADNFEATSTKKLSAYPGPWMAPTQPLQIDVNLGYEVLYNS